MAGQLKRKYPDLVEDVTLIRALRDSNVPKFLTFDLPLFAGIITDLYPEAEVPFVDYGNLQTSIEGQLRAARLQVVICDLLLLWLILLLLFLLSSLFYCYYYYYQVLLLVFSLVLLLSLLLLFRWMIFPAFVGKIIQLLETQLVRHVKYVMHCTTSSCYVILECIIECVYIYIYIYIFKYIYIYIYIYIHIYT